MNDYPRPALPSGITLIRAVASIAMKVPWPEVYEDGNSRTFLEEFEDVAELAGKRSNQGKLMVFRELLMGPVRAVLDTARRGPERVQLAAAKVSHSHRYPIKRPYL
ncbi:unnamed protein product [Echinostoma caproni]|uniref:DUF5753 domain-containing protein n=1 Tax=Echinostoma caproni TaxID=27848 RepID=A0A183AK58_9TREM|nr:unnamed protein product [Echinostoma caproni]